jgi:hypothetical protein
MSVLGAIIERKREEVAARRAAEPDAALICYPREFSLRANILDVADQVIFIWCGLKGRAGARAEAAGPTRGFEDALRGPAPAASGPSAGIRGCGGIRAPLHPRPPRRAPSTIGSTRSPRSRSSRARRIGALGASPPPRIPAPSIIAELKRASPSRGPIRPGADPAHRRFPGARRAVEEAPMRVSSPSPLGGPTRPEGGSR